jgi:F420-dependent oxidoreductase-like protein
MKIGLQIPNFTWPGGPARLASTFADIARVADEGGFASLWVMDHFFQIDQLFDLPPESEMLEGYGALSYLAGITSRVTLGPLVVGAIYRHPGILIKTASTLDVLSGGRTYFGIGAGWYERESRGLGVPFPPIAERFARLEEVLLIARQMWSDNNGPFEGKYYQLAETLNHPQPLSQPHPPLMIGGTGERKTLRLVAQYADACNIFAGNGGEWMRAKLAVLQRHCEALGRDYAEIEKTSLGPVHLAPGQQSATEVIAHCRDLADLGIQHAIFNMPNVADITPLEIFCREIIPEVAAL